MGGGGGVGGGVVGRGGVKMKNRKSVSEIISQFLYILMNIYEIILRFYRIKYMKVDFIPHHTLVAGYCVFTWAIRVSVRTSVRPSVVRPSVRPTSFPFGNLRYKQISFKICI